MTVKYKFVTAPERYGLSVCEHCIYEYNQHPSVCYVCETIRPPAVAIGRKKKDHEEYAAMMARHRLGIYLDSDYKDKEDGDDTRR